MHKASKTNRWMFVSLLLLSLSHGFGLPAAASVRRAPGRARYATFRARHPHAHVAAPRSRLRRANRPSYLRVSAPIPNQRNESASPGLPPSAFPTQQEQRIPRQGSAKTAALQGMIHDAAGHAVVGALVALTNRVSGMTRTISADADGVFRLTDLAPGSYLLLVQSDGF